MHHKALTITISNFAFCWFHYNGSYSINLNLDSKEMFLKCVSSTISLIKSSSCLFFLKKRYKRIMLVDSERTELANS